MRAHIVEPQRVDGGVGCVIIKMTRVDDRDFPEWFKLWRCDLFPALAAIAGDMHQAVVGTRPNAIDIER